MEYVDNDEKRGVILAVCDLFHDGLLLSWMSGMFPRGLE